MKRYIGVDLGGTNIVCGVVREDGETEDLVKLATEASGGSDHVVARLAGGIRELCAKAGLALADAAGIGLGVPGFVDPEAGVAVKAVNLGWRQVPLVRTLKQSLAHEHIYIDNDVRMYVYGEATAGAGVGRRHVLGVTVGTGLAAAMVHDGRLYYGAGGRAGELGHIRVEGNPARCNCGRTGCLETIASATGIARLAREALEQGKPSLLREWFPERDWPRITAADVGRGCERRDEVCLGVMEYVGTMLGRGLATAVTLLSPDIVIVGGGAARAGELLLGPALREIRERVPEAVAEELAVTTAHRLEDAGVVGSALYARTRTMAEEERA